MSDEEVLSALKALAEADAPREAPPVIEQRLRVAFRNKRRVRVWPWIMAAAAAIVVMIGVVYFRPRPVEPVRVVVTESPRVIEIGPLTEPVKSVAHTPRRTRTREVVTDFFPLVEIAPPLDRAELVRVSLPAAAMRTVGLPVREDRLAERVNADVLVSEEGVATAIRFVKFQ